MVEDKQAMQSESMGNKKIEKGGGEKEDYDKDEKELDKEPGSEGDEWEAVEEEEESEEE